MDRFTLLPLELKEYIFKFLSGQDLWTCLSVSEEWRRIANLQNAWKNVCYRERIDTEGFTEEEKDGSLTLCKYAVLWKQNELTVNRWRINNFEEGRIPYENPAELTCRKIFIHKRIVAVLTSKTMPDDSEIPILQIHSFDKKSNYMDEIILSLSKPNAVMINNKYVAISINNVVIVFRKDVDYKMFLGIAFNDDSKLYLSTEGVPEFAALNFQTKPCIRIEALLKDYLWFACINYSSHLLYILNLKTLKLLDLKIKPRLIRVTRKYVVVLSKEGIIVLTYNGELVSKLNVHGGFKATDDFIVTSPEQGEPLAIWTIKANILRVIPGPVLFELDPVRHYLYECSSSGEENSELSAMCLKTGDRIWSTVMKKCKLSEIDEMYQVCDRFLIIDFYKETDVPNFHHAFVYDLDEHKLLYKTALTGFTIKISNNIWILKTGDDLVVQIY